MPGDVLVTSEDDLELPLAQAVGDEALLLFWRSDCGFCEQILEDVRELEASTPIRIVSGSDPASLRATGLISTVLRDPTGALESWLRCPGHALGGMGSPGHPGLVRRGGGTRGPRTAARQIPPA